MSEGLATDTDTDTDYDAGGYDDAGDVDGYDAGDVDGYDAGDVDGYDLDDELDDDELDDEDDRAGGYGLELTDFDEDDLDDEDEDEDDDEEELDEAEADEVVLGLLQRVEDGEQLDRWEIRDLGLLLGDKKAGGALGRQLNKEAKESQGRRPKRRRGLWHWFAGPIHEQPDPIPNSLAAILLRIQEGRPLDASDFKRLGGVIGRRTVRAFEAMIHGAVERDDRRHRRGRGGRR